MRATTRPHALTPSVLAAPKTKTDVAYQRLRRAIVTGDIGPDEPLDEAALINRYELSRTPLREALKHLALEQFVSWPNHATPYVRGVEAHELPQLFEARMLLEEPAGRLAAARMSESDLERLDVTSEAIERRIAAAEFYEAVELDHALHLEIANASGNRFISQAVSRLNCGSLRLWYVAHEQVHDQTGTARHAELLAALRSRDPDRVTAETRRHIVTSYKRQLILRGRPLDAPGPLDDLA